MGNKQPPTVAPRPVAALKRSSVRSLKDTTTIATVTTAVGHDRTHQKRHAFDRTENAHRCREDDNQRVFAQSPSPVVEQSARLNEKQVDRCCCWRVWCRHCYCDRCVVGRCYCPTVSRAGTKTKTSTTFAVACVTTPLLLALCWSHAVIGVAVNFGGGCPSSCSGHGYCTAPKTEECSCYQGWGGGDCSIRLCPSGNAWVDHATANNTAHAAYTECSNMGICNRSTGRCECRAGFTGEACQRLTCHDDCNGRGRCMSMRDAAAVIDGQSLEFEGVYDGWDADMIHGCLCDDGWEGYDCSLRTCPKGVDPYPSAAGESEEQLIDCACPETCSGSLLLGFRGHTTRPVPFDASAELVKHRLEELITIEEILVNITGSGETICAGNNGTTTRVTFFSQYGSLSNITTDMFTLASSTSTPSVSVFAKGQASDLNPHQWSRTGTKEPQECSGRGYCNRQTGHCLCYSKFGSSDGHGGTGEIGDCGYFDPYDPPTNCSFATPLWGSTSDICSGAGNCNSTTFRCNCTEATSGGACELMKCDTGVAWFEEAAWNITAGAEGGRLGMSVECSAGGICDESSGNCTCRSGVFNGTACNTLDCYSTCGEYGECRDMAYFAESARSNGEEQSFTYDLWDADKMTSCFCNRTQAADNFYSGTSTTYRGPYAFADTDSYGYDCSLGRCPTGDHYHTAGVTDVQRVNCSGEVGVFTLNFRGGRTVELPYYVSAGDIETALEASVWILDVEVTYSGGSFACNETEYFDIEFLTENGDLPLVVPDSTFLFQSDGTTPGKITVEKVRTGTREDVECAGHGICIEETGICDCFVGYQSSDGQGSIGQRGDCGWRNDYQTALFSGGGTASDYN